MGALRPLGSLGADSSGHATTTGLPLSETHGKLLPWDPPEFGIPASVLACMRDELRKTLVDRAIAVGRQRVSKREARDTSDDNWLKEAVGLIAAHAKIRRPGDL